MGFRPGCKTAWDQITPDTDPQHPHWLRNKPPDNAEQGWLDQGWKRLRNRAWREGTGTSRWNWVRPPGLGTRPMICADGEGIPGTPPSPTPVDTHPETSIIVSAPRPDHGLNPQPMPVAPVSTDAPPYPQPATYGAPGPFPTSGFQPFTAMPAGRPYADDPESAETISTAELTVHYEARGVSWSAYQV